MKKYMVLCAGLCAAVAFTSCKSSKETAYRKMYEKAQLQDQNGAEQNQGNEEIAVVAPVVEKPATETVVVPTPKVRRAPSRAVATMHRWPTTAATRCIV